MRGAHPILPRRLSLLLAAGVWLAACGILQPTPTPLPTPAPATPTPFPTPSPSPTPRPTPTYTNPPDAALAALIPIEVNGHTVTIPGVTEFSVTPGDIGAVYGDLGLRFRALQLAWVGRPRLSLYAVRVEAPAMRTEELEPFLAEAGRYVGIAGLHREPWQLQAFGDHLAWWRPEDNATPTGTQVYTWASGDLLFLMLGTDQATNLAMLAALPGELPPATPEPSVSAGPSGSPS
jgi:hypothetical protein